VILWLHELPRSPCRHANVSREEECEEDDVGSIVEEEGLPVGPAIGASAIALVSLVVVRVGAAFDDTIPPASLMNPRHGFANNISTLCNASNQCERTAPIHNNTSPIVGFLGRWCIGVIIDEEEHELILFDGLLFCAQRR
jgi:hypothetical protein